MRFKEFMQLSEQTIGDVVRGYYQGKYHPMTMDNLIRGVFANNNDRLKAWQDQQHSAQDQQWNQVYSQAKEGIKAAMEKRKWRVEDSGAWFQSQKKGTMQKVDGKTHKRYYSIDPKQMATLLKYLPWLGDALGQIQTQGNLSFKIPSNWGGFMKERDSLVVHFYDPNISGEVDQAVRSFMQKAQIQPLDRSQFVGANDTGVDINGQSDTQLIAQHFLRNLDHNKATFMQMDQQDPSRFEQALTDLWKHLVAKKAHH